MLMVVSLMGKFWEEGRLIFAFYKEFGEVDVLIAESLSLLHGLQLCRNAQVQCLLVEVNS